MVANGYFDGVPTEVIDLQQREYICEQPALFRENLCCGVGM